MKRKYAYVFPLSMPNGSCKLQWSSEAADTLARRADNDDDRNLILDFIKTGSIGSFISLDTGEMIFQIA